MPGKIFYRERQKVTEGKKQPRFMLVAVADVNLKVYGKHLRRSELDQIAAAVGAELILLTHGDKKYQDDEVEVKG
jgi:ribonuclease BN (tRNA processing enzyme)